MSSELTYDDFLDRLSIQEVLVDAGYHLNKRDGLRYPSYVRTDSEGRRVRGDKFIVTQNGKCCFQPPQQKVYNVISFIKEHPEMFSENKVGMSPDRLVNLVCNRVPYLSGEKHPSGTRLTDYQKCVRTGDIESVGDPAHLTFFEMLGNWSLGDYFKKESIGFSYEFLTSEKYLGIPKEKLSVTVFAGENADGVEIPRDNESATIWESLGIAHDHIYFLPREDNWWGPAGATGPCGPDTEIFYDTGKPKCGPDCKPGCHCGKFVEIWNNVFMQYNKDAAGKF